MQVPKVTRARLAPDALGVWLRVSPDLRQISGSRSGCGPDVRPAAPAQARHVARYLLQHRHTADECGVVFASFKGSGSPLRHRATLASCRSGGHAIWWTVETETEREALRFLPFFVAERTTIVRVSEVNIP